MSQQMESPGGFPRNQVEMLFGMRCASCHMDGGQSRAPALAHLGSMSPRSIYASMATGKMKPMSAGLTDSQMVAISELLTNLTYTESTPIVNACEQPGQITEDILLEGWGGNPHGTGFVPESIAGMTREQVGTLELAWAFGFEGGSITRTKPAIIGEVMLFGSQFGEIWCLDRRDGCVRWVFNADANVRGGLAISEYETGLRVHAADFGGNVYALELQTGELIWKTTVKNEPSNAVTGTPISHDGILYIPLTSMEVATAGMDHYQCCKGSGQVVAISTEDGTEIWRHRVIQQEATEQGKSRTGNPQFGPSGAPVWGSPTVDAKRGYLYIGTGENNSAPWTETSDALQALDLKTGELIWNWQATSRDIYISRCPDGGNCPDDHGPDVDFGMAPVLLTRQDHSEVIVAAQKSGVVHCLNPDDGTVLWQTRIGRGGALGGVHWGLTSDGNQVYVSNSDWLEMGGEPGVEAAPGLYALDLMNGEVKWRYQSNGSGCGEGCYATHSAAPSMIGGVVFAGSLDGWFRAHDAETGEVLWETQTNTAFETLNGVEAHGGAIDGPGPVIAGGMVYVNSGYGMFSQMPGNVLLAFRIKE